MYHELLAYISDYIVWLIAYKYLVYFVKIVFFLLLSFKWCKTYRILQPRTLHCGQTLNSSQDNQPPVCVHCKKWCSVHERNSLYSGSLKACQLRSVIHDSINVHRLLMLYSKHTRKIPPCSKCVPSVLLKYFKTINNECYLIVIRFKIWFSKQRLHFTVVFHKNLLKAKLYFVDFQSWSKL